jgi:hypothetical protein
MPHREILDGEVGSTGGTSGGDGTPSTDPPSELSSPCKSNGGVFGTLTDVDTSIEFGYELETTTTRAITTAVIMPILEQAMVDMILSEVFEDQCSDTVRRSLRVERRMKVVGISRNPEDIVLDNGMLSYFCSCNLPLYPT